MGHSHMPPVPPDSRTRKGTGGAERPATDAAKRKGPPENAAEQAHQGSIHQNTHHQGYQQDR
ncbi:hypothetical protein [Propylenella binzhouense]|uniref:Uncharacterized protein n=1 Tax=Propylenella binzhouense TaxID=2555902 RepID=A0A964T617_9HYPH|nr:hypothetical protein [Propylenella binzhouense]MYZ49074.1 hypothetical protein [Propylenella binzhouense]